MKKKLQMKLAFLLLMAGGVGCAMAHTADESNEVARTMLKVANFYNGMHGCKIGDIVMNYSLPQVFFGKIDTGEGWTYEGRQAAFDRYVNEMALIDYSTSTNTAQFWGYLAVAQCQSMSYTNAVPSLRALALNTTCPNRIRSRAIKAVIGMSDISTDMLDFTVSIVTNTASYSLQERGEACGLYIDKVLSSTNSNDEQRAVCNQSVDFFFKRRLADVAGAAILDQLFMQKISGYANSSNRLEVALHVLASPESNHLIKRHFTSITNQLLSSGQPLIQLDIGVGGN